MKKKDVLNPDGFRYLLNYAINLDNDIKKHLEESIVFKGVSSSTIQNELPECVVEVYRSLKSAKHNL